ncbi:MAG: nucleotidyltransferase domain-containing protein [Balneolaceae bacterium]
MPEQKKRNRFGLTGRDMKAIQTIFESYPEVKTVYVFGSRAKGNYRTGSDVDLAIMNEGISIKRLSRLRSDFEESSLPYKIDLVDFTHIEKQEFIDHINRVGVPFFVQNENIHLPKE